MDALELLSVLASSTRLGVLGALALHGPAATPALAASTGLPPRDLQRALGALVASGLVQRDGGEYRADAAVLRRAVDEAAAATPLGRVLPRFPELRAVTSLGRIVAIPAGPRARRRLAEAVLAALPAFAETDEPTLDASLRALGSDVANLRRLLVDEGVLERTADGRRYWPAST